MNAVRQQLFIRVDANEQIAMGHVMRCLSIADAFQSKGGTVHFLLADHCVCDLLAQRGFAWHVLNSNWQDMDSEIEQLAKILQTETRLTGEKPKILVDSYQVTENYLRLLGKYARVIYIDDRQQLTIPAAIVVNYTSFTEIDAKNCYPNPDTVLCLGWQYTPLNSAFASLKHHFSTEVKNILITTGGSDPDEISALLSKQMLQHESFKDIKLHVVAGKFCHCMNTLWQIQRQEKNERFRLYQNIDHIEEIMMQCDFAISAGGTTLFELFACSVPVIAFGYAENQLESLHLLEKEGALCYAGDIREGVESATERMIELAEEFCRNPALRKEYEERGNAITDGKGAFRIVEAIWGLGDEG